VTLGRPGAITTDINTAAGFNGTSNTVRIPSGASISPSSALTLEAWVNPAAYPTSSNSILRKDGQYALHLTSSGAILLRLWKGGTSYDLTTPAGLVTLRSWTHIAATWDGSTMTIYVNGNVTTSQPLSGPIDSPNTSLYLASTYNSFDYYAGDLDEVAVYPVALTMRPRAGSLPRRLPA
jgi:Concanavalin A-like lectin/glucanases superfamily